MYECKTTTPINRQTWIDVAKGIGILSVLVGHNVSFFKPIIFSFHMPLFFILTGYTLKKADKNQLLSATGKDFKRLIIPCFIVQLVLVLGHILINHKDFISEIKRALLSLLWGNHYGSLMGIEMPSIGRIWFLIALFWAKLIYRILVLLLDDLKRFIVIFLLASASIVMGINGIILPQNFDMIFICVLFIEFGNKLKSIDFKSYNIIFYILLLAFWSFLCYRGIWISMNQRSYPGYGLCILVAIAGCLCVFRFCIFLSNTALSNIFSFFGVNSLLLLCIHSIAPNFYSASTNIQRCADMLIECLFVVIFVCFKKLLTKAIQIHQ